MRIKLTTRSVIVLLLLISQTSLAVGCAQDLSIPKCQIAEANLIDAILNQLTQKTNDLKSYQANIEYLFTQPLLESKSLRKGTLYYQKLADKSSLRINFQTLKQDDEKEQSYIEQYIFDGTWLTHIDYQLKTVKMRQLAEPNEPADAFELIQTNFPIIGFSKTEELKKEFEIRLLEKPERKENQIVLDLKVKPDSIYKDDYTSIEFVIDENLYLPAEIITTSTEEDIYHFKLLDTKVNQKIKKEVFEFKIPKDFSQPEIIPLKKKPKQK